tara:strand:- start:234 stop:773 length:540 start_codon:yes stop_codon:yes gene_type:complete
MPLKIKIGNPKPAPQATVELRVSKTLDGNYLIKDHFKMDVIVVPKEGKVMTVPKLGASDGIYEYQVDLLNSLYLGGVVRVDSIQGGSRFGVLEGYYNQKAAGVDPTQVVLLEIDKYIKKALAEDNPAEQYDKHIEDYFTDPTDEDSTAYGTIKPEQDEPYRQSQMQDPSYMFSGYGYWY